MKKLQIATAIMVIMTLSLVLAGCGKQSRAANANPTGSSTGQSVTPNLPGSMGRLNAALSEKSAVQYRILTADLAVANRDAYLDQMLAGRQWPTKDMLVFVIFTKDNHDIRFAMGSSFMEQKVSINEMLSLVRTHYLPKAREGDPAAGLADLVIAVNKRMN